MDWANERYVRVYVRDTVSWKLMDWKARTVFLHLLRKVDRAGVLDVGGDGQLGMAALLEIPVEVVRDALVQLTIPRTEGVTPTVVATPTSYVIPNFLEAQDASQSDAQRKRESRARRRESALTGHETSRDGHETGQTVTKRPATVTSGHAESRSVTPDQTVPDPDLVPVDARPEEGSLKKTRGKRPVGPMPDGWQPRPQERSKAAELGLDCDRQVERFRNHHEAKGNLFANWDAAFRNWLGNGAEFAAERGSGPSNKQTEIRTNMRPL